MSGAGCGRCQIANFGEKPLLQENDLKTRPPHFKTLDNHPLPILPWCILFDPPTIRHKILTYLHKNSNSNSPENGIPIWNGTCQCFSVISFTRFPVNMAIDCVLVLSELT